MGTSGTNFLVDSINSFELKEREFRVLRSILVKAYLSGKHFLHCHLQNLQVVAGENFWGYNLTVLKLLRETILLLSISEKGKIFE